MMDSHFRGLGLSAIVAAGVGLCGAVRAATSLDYVQDGLVAHWDGYENAGRFSHVAATNVWHDLVNGYAIVKGDGAAFLVNSNSVTVPVSSTANGSCPYLANMAFPDYTVEVTARCLQRADYANPLYMFSHARGYLFLRNASEGMWVRYRSSIDKDQWYNTAKFMTTGFDAFHTFTLSTTYGTAPYRFAIDGEDRTSSMGNGTTGNWTAPGTVFTLGRSSGTVSYEFQSIRIYSRLLTVAEIASNRTVDVARFVNGATSAPGVLQVEGAPAPYGTVTPAYGIHRDLAAGEGVACSVTSSVATGQTNLTCTGYVVYTNGVRTAGAEYAQGAGTSFEYVPPADVCGTLVWNWTAVADASFPLVTNVTADAAYGDTLTVRGDLAAFTGASCSLRVFTREASQLEAVEWTDAAWTKTATGAFELTLHEDDPLSPRALKFGTTYLVYVEATADGKSSRSETVLVMTPRTYLTSRSYVRNGLTSLYDGLENAGVAVHADTLTAWKDLVGNGDIPLSASTAAVGTDAVRLLYGSYLDGRSAALASNGAPVTVELMLRAARLIQSGTPQYTFCGAPILFYFGSTSEGLVLRVPTATASKAFTDKGTFTDYFNYHTYATQSWDPSTSACSLAIDGTEVPLTAGATVAALTANETFRLGRDSTAQMESDYRSIRVYSRRLSENELRQNRWVDRIRFDGEDPADVLPDGVRAVSGGDVQYRIRVIASGAGVGTNGTDFAMGTNDFWMVGGTPMTLYAETAPGRWIAWPGTPAGSVAEADGARVTFAVPFEPVTIMTDAFTPTHVWTGAAGTTDFATAGNWADAAGAAVAAAPGIESDVYVPGGCAKNPVASAPFAVKSFRIGALAGEAVTATFTADTLGTNTTSGCVAVYGGGTMTHTAGTAKLNVTAGGDVLVAAGGRMDAIGKGSSSEGKYASYGGEGPNYSTLGVCYGSLRYPHDLGSAGHQKSGSGAIRVFAGGTIRVDGTITAEGQNITHAGSGGSVWLDAARIVGTGVISAHGSDGTNLTSGGGRIALYLRDEEARFEDFAGTVTACGGYTTSWYSAAGTVYEQLADQADGEGTLIVDNNGVDYSTRVTAITPSVRDAEVGEVILRGKAYLKVEDGCELRVRRGLCNESGGTAIPVTGPIRLVGAEDAHLAGPLSFTSLSCEVPGKRIFFGTDAADAVTAVADSTVTFRGTSEVPVWLLPETNAAGGADGKWTLNANTTHFTVEYAAVSNCTASGGTTTVMVFGGRDLGGNDANVRFSDFIIPGETIRWTGNANTAWAMAGNWNRGRIPVETDVVLIEAGASRWPEITASELRVNKLEVEATARLTARGANLVVTNGLSVAGEFLLNGCALTVSNVLAVAATGRFTCSGSETVTVCGDLSFGDSACLTAADSTFRLDGRGAPTVNPCGVTFARLLMPSDAGDYTFGEGFSAFAVTIYPPAVSRCITFASGETWSADIVRIDGTVSGIAAMTLRGTSEATPWRVRRGMVGFAKGVIVKGSEAVGGKTMYAYQPSTDASAGTGNPGWSFGGTAFEWTAGKDGAFETGSNWSTGTVPGADDGVYLWSDAARTVTANSDVRVKDLVTGGGAALTTLAAQGRVEVDSLTILERGKVQLTKPMTATGLAVIASGGTLTHRGPASADNGDSVDVTAPAMTVAAGGQINVVLKGYAGKCGPATGYGSAFGGAGSYGGKGGQYQGGSCECYGSVCCPTNWGAGSQNNTSFHGGGRVRLRIAGELVLDGDIEAGDEGCETQNSVGAGGSVWITAGRLTGSGRIEADAYCKNLLGGGGRVAIELTDPAARYADFTGTVQTRSGKTSSFSAGTGTIYVKERTWNYGKVLVEAGDVSGGGMTPFGIPQSAGGDPRRVSRNFEITVRDGGKMSLVGDYSVRDLDLATANASLALGTNTLTIYSSLHKNGRGWASGATVTCTTNAQTGVYGKIVWKCPGFALIVR